MFEHIKLGGRNPFQIKKNKKKPEKTKNKTQKTFKIKKKLDKCQSGMMSALTAYLIFEENKGSITFRA